MLLIIARWQKPLSTEAYAMLENWKRPNSPERTAVVRQWVDPIRTHRGKSCGLRCSR